MSGLRLSATHRCPGCCERAGGTDDGYRVDRTGGTCHDIGTRAGTGTRRPDPPLPTCRRVDPNQRTGVVAIDRLVAEAVIRSPGCAVVVPVVGGHTSPAANGTRRRVAVAGIRDRAGIWDPAGIGDPAGAQDPATGKR